MCLAEAQIVRASHDIRNRDPVLTVSQLTSSIPDAVGDAFWQKASTAEGHPDPNVIQIRSAFVIDHDL